MCTYSQGIKEIAWQEGRQEGRLEGKQEGIAQTLQIYMEKNQTGLQEAMAYFCYPESDFELYEGLIIQNQKQTGK